MIEGNECRVQNAEFRILIGTVMNPELRTLNSAFIKSVTSRKPFGQGKTDLSGGRE
jgi:hypothetical protein